MSTISLGAHGKAEGLPEAAVNITINVSFSDDAPPSLVAAVGKSLGEIMLAWNAEETLDKIVQEYEEIRARHQRQADCAARMLLGEEEPRS